MVGQDGNTHGPLAFTASRLPYNTQHVVLLAAQRMLEEACFGFAQKFLPTVLQQARFDCPAAVELTRWIKILTKHRDKLGTTIAPGLKTPSFPTLMRSMRVLRHTIVHRIPVSAATVFQLVDSAAELAKVLQDDARAKLMRDIWEDVAVNLEETNTELEALRETVNEELEEICQAREELDRKEKDIISQALSKEAERGRERGQRLEQTVSDTIANWDVQVVQRWWEPRQEMAPASAPLNSPMLTADAKVSNAGS